MIDLPKDKVLIFPTEHMPKPQLETLERAVVHMNRYANGEDLK
jgi:hypothetical protein